MQVAVLAEAAAPVAASSEPDRPVLRVDDLEKSFAAGVRVLRGVSLSLGAGESVALIGANGAGKSTLLRCCLRLIEPDGGRIDLLDRDVGALGGKRLRELRARVGFVFQRHNLVPGLSALTNVIHGAQARRSGPSVWYQCLASRATREEALHCLDRVGLADVAARRADRLSGGQSQRVAIARVLMQRPQLVFADEPVASLDPRAGEEVMALFTETMRRENLSVLFTTHNVRDAVAYSDRVVGLQRGRVTLCAPSHSQNADQLREVYADDGP